jgi:16S rRNA (cytidine1402-2'-O)-methyltransferase
LTSSLSASFAPALSAAREAASHQHYPQGALFVVATPIGNLADITLRALHVLALVDAVACEDTRHTQQLLRAYGIERPGAQLLAVHQHNEAEAAGAGDRPAAPGRAHRLRVSDAGTPAISDPGARLVASRARRRPAAWCRCPAPAASPPLSVAGMTWREGGFVFAGFLPAKAAERERAVQALAGEVRAVVLLEAPAPHRSAGRRPGRAGRAPGHAGRELTKQFEQVVTLPARRLPAWLAADAQPPRGEFVAGAAPRPRRRPQAGDTCACCSCCWPSCR